MRRPQRAWTVVALVGAAAGAAGLWWWWSRRWAAEPWLWAWLGAVNPVAFACYGLDKTQARRRGARIPEATLHALALTGGSAGAWAGMQAFRHKTVKGRFRAVFWTIVLLQAAAVAWLVWSRWR